MPRPSIGQVSAGAAAAAPVTSNTDPELEQRMDEVSSFYDRGDYQAAQDKALEVLESSPRNIRMLRVVVSTSCMFGELERARDLNTRLPKKSQEDMRKRCKRYGYDL